MNEPMTREQAEVLAKFIHTLRPEWDEAGVLVALGRARDRGSAADVAHAAIACAMTPDARTPAVIALEGSHWHAYRRGDGQYRPPRREEECRVHPGNYRDSCRGCAADRLALQEHEEEYEDLEYDPRGDRDYSVRYMRSYLNRMRSTLCRHNVDLARGRCTECEKHLDAKPLPMKMRAIVQGRMVEDVELPYADE